MPGRDKGRARPGEIVVTVERTTNEHRPWNKWMGIGTARPEGGGAEEEEEGTGNT
jgi:hypothetical protein